MQVLGQQSLDNILWYVNFSGHTARVNKLILVLRIRTSDKTNRWNLDTVLNIPQRTGSVPVGDSMYSLSLDHRYDNGNNNNNGFVSKTSYIKQQSLSLSLIYRWIAKRSICISLSLFNVSMDCQKEHLQAKSKLYLFSKC